MQALLLTFVTFVLTSVIGAGIAHRWQGRALKDTRLFDASRETYDKMSKVADDLISLVSARIYSSQRIVLLVPSNPIYAEALADYTKDVVAWNKALMSLELRIKLLFRTVKAQDLEPLQSRLRQLNIAVEATVRDPSLSSTARRTIHSNFGMLRFDYGSYCESMIAESRLLFREMHFGIKGDANLQTLERVSSFHLFKLLFKSRKDGLTVLSAPADLGAPVSGWDARFRIYE